MHVVPTVPQVELVHMQLRLCLHTETLLLVLPHIPFVLEEHHSVLAADSVQVEHVVVEEVAQVM